MPVCEGNRSENSKIPNIVRIRYKSRCQSTGVDRYRLSQTVPDGPDASRGPVEWIRQTKRAGRAKGSNIPVRAGHRLEHRVRAHRKSGQNPGVSAPICAGTDGPGPVGHRLEHRVRAHRKSRCLGADMCRYRWSQTVFLFPDAPRGPEGRIG